MHLNIFIVLYSPPFAAGAVQNKEGALNYNTKLKSCFLKQKCLNESVNLGVLRSVVSMQCCNTDLCNNKDAPDLNAYSANGKQCYSCDGNSCSNKLNCLGTEDYCIKAKANITSLNLPSVLKGCVSKSLCDAATQAASLGILEFSCCQGNLCNSARSITQSFLLFSWPILIFLLFH